MKKQIETGVFLPVGNHGWIHSTNSPAVEDGSFARVLEVTKCAEALGLDFVLSPGIWRGRRGPSEHWMRSLESMTTTAALLQATSRIRVFGTIHMTIYQPAVIAKMITTLDQIGPGRVGLNLVTGSSYLDLSHVGLWSNDLSHEERYDLGDEWVKVVKRLWTEDTVSHQGKFFELVEATMGPKPSRIPPLVNAGASGRGFKFASDNCDIAFISAGDNEKQIESGKLAKANAKNLNRPDMKVFGLVTLIPGDSDEDAEARLKHFNDGVDLVCLEDIAAGYSMNPSVKQVSAASLALAGGEKRSSVMPGELVGSYETLAKRLAKTINEGELDGVLIVVPDYVNDLDAIAKKTLPLLGEYGISCNINVGQS